jgi:hypothetical protein
MTMSFIDELSKIDDPVSLADALSKHHDGKPVVWGSGRIEEIRKPRESNADYTIELEPKLQAELGVKRLDLELVSKSNFFWTIITEQRREDLKKSKWVYVYAIRMRDKGSIEVVWLLGKQMQLLKEAS